MPSYIRLQDVADILIMTFLLYQLYSWFSRTRAMQVLLGLGVVTLIYFATRFLGLYMTSWILQELGTVLIVLIIVVFQAEIRQALYRFSLLRHLFDARRNEQGSHFQETAETIFNLAGSRTGAIVVFQRSESLADQMLNGVKLDCEVNPQILQTIFIDGTPLHDGAVLIKDGRIAAASCHLPLSVNSEVPQHFGTRHRAALGLSERSDAVVVVVSEERGEVSLAVGGELRRMATPAELIAALDEMINPVRETTRNSLPRMFFSNLLPKAAILLIVSVFWVLITSRQGQITTVMAPLRLHGLPDDMVLVKGLPEEVDVQLKSLSSLAPLPSRIDIAADVDLSEIHEGHNTIRIKASDFTLPSGMEMSSVTPAAIKVVAERKKRKTVPVKIVVRGTPKGMKNVIVAVDPATVVVEGPALQVAHIDFVATEEIDGTRLVKGKEYRANLLPPEKRVTVLREEPVIVRLMSRGKK
ncbi:diadenylate cyclase CdaA [Pelotalea chapellei]